MTQNGAASETPVSSAIDINGQYTVSDHGIEYFTDTDLAVYTIIVYGNNLKNKLERDVLTISQQSLTAGQKTQVLTNIGGASAASVSSLSDQMGKVVKIRQLADYTDTTATSVQFAENANNYLLIVVRLHDSNNNVCATVTVPPFLMRNITFKIYGESSSQWGSVLVSNDYLSATFNRTSSNTTKISVYGVINLTGVNS